MNIDDFDIEGLIFDDDYSLDEKAARLRLVRSRLNVTNQKKLDRLCIKRLCTYQNSIRDLVEIKEKAQALIEKLTSEPFYPAYFIAAANTAKGSLLRVRYHNEDLFVNFGDDLDIKSLKPGDEILLNAKRNIALYKSDCMQATGELAIVDRVLGDNRLVITNNGAEYVVNLPSGFICKKGDTVRWNKRANMVLERLENDAPESTKIRDQFDLDKIRGIDLKTMANQISNMLLSGETAKHYHVGDNKNKILCFGEPGTGKTTFAQAVAGDLEKKVGKSVLFKAINGEELSSPYVGQTSANIRAAFAQCNEYVETPNSHCVLFIDEIDVYRRRGLSNNHFHDRHTNTILTEIANLHPNVILIAATNQADALDSALRDRFSMEIKFSRPNRQIAKEIFDVHLSADLPYECDGMTADETRAQIIEQAVATLYSPNADNAVAVLKFRDSKSRLIKAAELISGRLISQITANIKQNAFHRHMAGGKPGISVNDMVLAVHSAIDRLRKTLTRQNVYSYLSNLPQDADVISVEPVTNTANKPTFLQ